MTAARTVPPLSRWNKASFGAGAVAIGAKNSAFGTFLLFFYNQVYGADAKIVSLAIMCALIIDAISDPIVGRLSDSFRSKWGRRHPFLYGAALPTAVLFFLAWHPPVDLSESATFVWLLVMVAGTRLSITFYEIPSSAMTPELSTDYAERTALFSYRYWFGYAGAFGTAALALLVFFAKTPEYPVGQLNPAGYEKYAWTCAILIFVAILTCAHGTQNRIPYLRQAGERRRGMKIGVHLREILGAFSNKDFLALFGFAIFKYSAIGLYSATTLYFGTYLWKLEAAALFVLTIDSFFAATVALFIAPICTRKFGKKASAIGGAVIGICIGISPLVLRYFDIFIPVESPLLLPVLFAIGVIYGSFIAVSLVSTSSMLADVVDAQAIKTGTHDSGVYFAASSFLQKSSSGIGVLMAGLVLSFADFPRGISPADISEATLDRLLVTYIPIVVSFWFIGAFMASFYKISRADHEANVASLASAEAARAQATGSPVATSPADEMKPKE